MTSDEFATSIGGIAMESDRINEVGCHVPVVVDKLFGPLIFRKLRVTAMFDGCYWLIERETGPENEWVEWCRIPGQLDIDFDKEATPLAEERAEMIATLTALLREARGYLPECIGLSEEIDALAADSAPDEGGA